MLIIGASVFLPAMNEHRPGSESGPVGLFLAVWFVVGISVVIYHLVNAMGGDVPAGESVEIEGEEQTHPRPAKERLEELEALRQSQTVTEDEYQQKRQEILGDL